MVYTNRRKKALYKSIAYRIVLPLPDGKREAIDEARLNDESRAPSFAPPPRTSWRVGSGRKPNDLFHSRPTARPTSSIGLSGSKTPKKPAPRAYRNRVLAALDRLPRPRPPVSAGPPVLFETLAFRKGGENDEQCERYSTWDDAEAGHAAMIRRPQR